MKRSQADGGGGAAKRPRGGGPAAYPAQLLSHLAALQLPPATTLAELDAKEEEERGELRALLAQMSAAEGGRRGEGGAEKSGVEREVEEAERKERIKERTQLQSTRELLFSAARAALGRLPGEKRRAAAAARGKGARGGEGGAAASGSGSGSGSESGSGSSSSSSSSGGSGSSSSSSSSSSSGGSAAESSEGEAMALAEEANPFGRRKRPGKKGARRAAAAPRRRGGGGGSSGSEGGEGSDSEGSGSPKRRLRRSTARARNAVLDSSSEGEGGEVSGMVRFAGGKGKAAASARKRMEEEYGSGGSEEEGGGGGGGGGGRRKGRKGASAYSDGSDGEEEWDDEAPAGDEGDAALFGEGGVAVLGDAAGGGGGGGRDALGAGLRALLRQTAPDFSAATAEDANSIRLTRAQALAALGRPYFAELATGCFVRVAKLGEVPRAEVEAGRATPYRVCWVAAVGHGPRAYDPWRSDGGAERGPRGRPGVDAASLVKQTDLLLHLGIGASLDVPTEVGLGAGPKRVENRPRASWWRGARCLARARARWKRRL